MMLRYRAHPHSVMLVSLRYAVATNYVCVPPGLFICEILITKNRFYLYLSSYAPNVVFPPINFHLPDPSSRILNLVHLGRTHRDPQSVLGLVCCVKRRGPEVYAACKT